MSAATDKMPASDDEVPLSEIIVDWDDFRRLPRLDREGFLIAVEQLYRTDSFGRNQRPQGIPWACVDLNEYADYPEFLASLKRNGKSFYEVKKAESRGYYSEFFDERTFIADIVAINTSAPERQGRPMGSVYMQTVEDRGGYPTEFVVPVAPAQAVFWQRRFGVFRASAGHRQGPLVVDKQLVAYLVAHRFGNFVHYHTILGHKEQLRDGIVHKMHHDFVKAVLDARRRALPGHSGDASLTGLRFVCYNGYYWTPGMRSGGITVWKKNNLFRPRYFSLDIGPAAGQTSVNSGDRNKAGSLPNVPRSYSESWMIRTGDYDAFDKWGLLSRHWGAEPSVEAGADGFGRRLPAWQSAAISAGQAAIFEYFRIKAGSLRSESAVGRSSVDDEAAIAQEIIDLWEGFRAGGLDGMIGRFVDSIVSDGYSAAWSDRFSPALVGRLKHVFQAAAVDRLRWTGEPGEIPTIDIIRRRSSLEFPIDAVRHKNKVLCVTDVREFGRAELIHIHDYAFPEQLTLVDTNAEAIEGIKSIYQGGWNYVVDNDRRFIKSAAERGEMFDLMVFNVSASRAHEVGLDDLPTIMGVCSDTLIVNYTNAMLDELDVGTYEFRRLSEAVTKRTGVTVEVTQLNREVDNLYWAVIRKR